MLTLHVIHITDSHGCEHTWCWLSVDADENEGDPLPPGVTLELRDRAAPSQEWVS